jgi:hypothetical protein
MMRSLAESTASRKRSSLSWSTSAETRSHLAPRHSQFDLGHHSRGEVLQCCDFFLGPFPRLHVDGAERADRVPLGRDQWDSRVRADAPLDDGEVVVHERVQLRIADHEWLTGRDRMLAERV